MLAEEVEVGEAMGSLMAATVVVEMMAVEAMRKKANDFMVVFVECRRGGVCRE